MLTVLDEYTREALAVTVASKMGSSEVLEALYPLLLKRGKPEYLRSDNVLCWESSVVLGIRSRGICGSRYLKNNFPGGLRRQEVVSSIANTGSTL